MLKMAASYNIFLPINTIITTDDAVIDSTCELQENCLQTENTHQQLMPPSEEEDDYMCKKTKSMHGNSNWNGTQFLPVGSIYLYLVQ